MRPAAALTVCSLLLELGWLAMWPLSTTLTHSELFTTSLLADHPLVGGLPLPITEPLGSAAYVAPVTALAALFLALALVYTVALAFLRGRTYEIWIIVAATVVFQLTLIAMPGLFSQDVFSYIAYGRATAIYGLNPYIWPPSVLRDASLNWVADVWRSYPSPYGPAWVSLQWLLAWIGQGLSVADQALVYRALASMLLLANLALAWQLLGRVTPLDSRQRTVALAALAWNPLLLFESAGNAHNDVLMVTFCLLGLVLLKRYRRGLPTAVAMALGTLVKYLSGIGLVWLAVASAARAPTWRGRLGRPLVLGTVALGVAVLSFAPWLEIPDSLDSLFNETARVGYVNSLPDALLVMVVNPSALEMARVVQRGVILVAFAVYLAWEAREVWYEPSRAGIVRGIARACLVYVVLVSTSVQTWYFCLPVSIAVLLGTRQPLARLAVAYSALALPALYLSYYLRELTPGWVFVVYAFAPLLVLLPHRRALALHAPAGWRRAQSTEVGSGRQALGLPRAGPIEGD